MVKSGDRKEEMKAGKITGREKSSIGGAVESRVVF